MITRNRIYLTGLMWGILAGAFIAIFFTVAFLLAMQGLWGGLAAFSAIGWIIGDVLFILGWRSYVAAVDVEQPFEPAPPRKKKTDPCINLDDLEGSCDCGQSVAPPSDLTHYNEYLRAFRKLMILENNGLDDCEEARQLRAKTDFHWLNMTPNERYAAEFAKVDLWKLPED